MCLNLLLDVRGANIFILTVSFFVTRLHERPLHFGKK